MRAGSARRRRGRLCSLGAIGASLLNPILILAMIAAAAPRRRIFKPFPYVERHLSDGARLILASHRARFFPRPHWRGRGWRRGRQRARRRRRGWGGRRRRRRHAYELANGLERRSIALLHGRELCSTELFLISKALLHVLELGLELSLDLRAIAGGWLGVARRHRRRHRRQRRRRAVLLVGAIEPARPCRWWRRRGRAVVQIGILILFAGR